VEQLGDEQIGIVHYVSHVEIDWVEDAAAPDPEYEMEEGVGGQAREIEDGEGGQHPGLQGVGEAGQRRQDPEVDPMIAHIAQDTRPLIREKDREVNPSLGVVTAVREVSRVNEGN